MDLAQINAGVARHARADNVRVHQARSYAIISVLIVKQITITAADAGTSVPVLVNTVVMECANATQVTCTVEGRASISRQTRIIAGHAGIFALPGRPVRADIVVVLRKHQRCAVRFV